MADRLDGGCFFSLHVSAQGGEATGVHLCSAATTVPTVCRCAADLNPGLPRRTAESCKPNNEKGGGSQQADLQNKSIFFGFVAADVKTLPNVLPPALTHPSTGRFSWVERSDARDQMQRRRDVSDSSGVSSSSSSLILRRSSGDASSNIADTSGR